MNGNTEKRILEAATKLFYTKGTQNVTMRDIANECGISPGNLTYYYRKKEDLFAVVYQDLLFKEFERLSSEAREDKGENPWVFFIAANYAHLKTVAENEMGLSEYVYATRAPCARDAYISANSALLYRCMENTRYMQDRKKTHIASMIGCGGEFAAMYTFQNKRDEYTFDDLIEPTFAARMLLMDVPREEIGEAIAKGKSKALHMLRATL